MTCFHPFIVLVRINGQLVCKECNAEVEREQIRLEELGHKGRSWRGR